MMIPPLLKYAYEVQEREEGEWGERTVVFMMVGSFYEVYGRRAEEVCGICNIVLTRKNKNVEESMANPKMCGFPCYNRARFVQKMVDEGYSVVIYDQKGDENNLTREKTMVFSPMISSTIAQTPDEEDGEFFGSGVARNERDRVGMSVMTGMGACSVVIINLTSGTVLLNEVVDHREPSRRFIEVVMAKHEPVEVFWAGGDAASLEWFRSADRHVRKWTTAERLPRMDIPMQEAILTRAYPPRNGMGAHESIGIEKWPLTSLNLAWMISVLHKQWPLVVDRLCEPVWGGDKSVVEFLPHTMRELHLSQGQPSLMQIMDRTCTVMGRRRFRAEWFHPRGSSKDLNDMYDAIEEGLADYDRVRSLRRVLSSFHDWECTLRRFHAGMFSVRRILCLMRDLASLGGFLDTADLVGSLRADFIMENLESGDWSMPMTRSTHADPAEIEFTGPDPLSVLRTRLGLKTTPDKNPALGVKALGLQEAGDEVFLSVRRARLASPPDLGSPFTVKQMAQVYRIYHPEWTAWFLRRRNEHLEVQRIHREAFDKTAAMWFGRNEHRLVMILSEVIASDMCCSRVEAARQHGLIRPVLDGEIEFRNMRNPVVEAIDSSRERFVCNDFALDMDERGILLFGQNSSGKCFSPGTLVIAADGTIIPISRIRTGDSLMGPDGSPRIVLGTVAGTGVMKRVVGSDGRVIMRATEDHIMLIHGKGLVRLDQCGSTVELIRNDGAIVGGRVEDDGVGPFVGLVISGDQLFCLSDGVIVHNSTYVKSIGMNVWLAQTGHYVFASSMSFTPFAGIYTKIETRDNLYKGQSTFVSEMLDLRHILSRAGRVSPALVLCDELTSGTETWSASSIVASTLHDLVRAEGLAFVMTTHLHTLQLFREVFEDPRIRVMHVHFSKGSEDFRRILPGEGPVMYGIEIAEKIGFSDEFIRRCYHYRTTITNRIDSIAASSEPVEPKRSRYNRSIVMTRCEECGSTNDLHTHHIIEQAACGPDKRTPGTNQGMNSAWNLRVLCSRCHHKQHHPNE